jgi:uncharacterized protein
MIFAPRCVQLLVVLLVTACAGAGEGTDAAAAPGSAVDAPATADTASPQAAASPGPLQPSEGFETATITLSSGDERIRMPVWVADEPHLRQRGLMERTSLPPEAGMLFVFPGSTDGGFWMKDTLIPLSIAFIGDDGRIVETLDMQPCAADPCDVYAPGSPYRYALEANLGFFDRHGVERGWAVDAGDALEAT